MAGAASSKVIQLLSMRRPLLLAKMPVRSRAGSMALAVGLAGIEATSAIVIVVAPRVGATSAAGLLLSYSAYLVISRPPGDCACFGGWFSFGHTPAGALIRNLALVAASVSVLALGSHSPRPAAFAVAVVVVALAYGIDRLMDGPAASLQLSRQRSVG